MLWFSFREMGTLKLVLRVVLLLLSLVAVLVVFSSGDEGPDVEFLSIEGVRMTDLKGKVTLVNFWATSCPTCIKEFPDLKRIHEKYKDQGYQTVAVAMYYDRLNYIRAFVEKNELPFFIVYDKDNSIAERYGKVSITPTSFLVDGEGNVVRSILGEINTEELEGLVLKYLKL